MSSNIIQYLILTNIHKLDFNIINEYIYYILKYNYHYEIIIIAFVIAFFYYKLYLSLNKLLFNKYNFDIIPPSNENFINYSDEFINIIDYLIDNYKHKFYKYTNYKYPKGGSGIAPLSEGLVKITDDIYIKIYELEFEQYEKNKDLNKGLLNKKIINKKVIISIQSYTSMDKILDFIKLCTEYINNKIKIATLKDVCFTYHYEEHQYFFNNYNFIVMKELKKNIFIENIDEIYEYIISYIEPEKYRNKLCENNGNNDILDLEEKYIIQENLYKRQKLYLEKSGEPKKQVFLLYGEPGCGKTSFIKGVIKLTGRIPIIVSWGDITTKKSFDLVFNTRIYNSIYPKGLDFSEVCYIIEDIDANNNKVLLKRKTYTEEQEFNESNILTKSLIELSEKNKELFLQKEADKLNLDYVLNKLNGFIELNNIMIFFTTNFIEKIDPAFYRKGRVDKLIHFTKCTYPIYKQIFKYYLNMEINHKFLIEKGVEDNKLKICDVVNIFCYTDNVDKIIRKIKNLQQFGEI